VTGVTEYIHTERDIQTQKARETIKYLNCLRIDNTKSEKSEAGTAILALHILPF